MDTKYPSNANNRESVEQRKKLDKIVTGDVIAKNTNTHRVLKALFPNLSHARGDILTSVIIPCGKRVLRDSLDIILEGDIRRDNGRRPNAPRVSYNGFYNNGNNNQQFNAPQRAPVYNYADICFTEYRDAVAVLDRMMESLDEYHRVPVGEFYELCGRTPESTDYNYGWYDLRAATIRSTINGYFIDFPPVVNLK